MSQTLIRAETEYYSALDMSFRTQRVIDLDRALRNNILYYGALFDFYHSLPHTNEEDRAEIKQELTYLENQKIYLIELKLNTPEDNKWNMYIRHYFCTN